MATLLDVVTALNLLQGSASQQLAELKGIQRAAWAQVNRSGTAAGAGAVGAAAAGAGGAGGGGGPAGAGGGRTGGGAQRGATFGRAGSASGAVAQGLGQGAVFNYGGAAAIGVKAGAALVKQVGEVSAINSDRNIGAVEKSFQTAERWTSLLTMGFGNGWLRDSWNRSGQMDFRDAMGRARQETLEIAGAAAEQGGTMSPAEMESVYRARYDKAKAFQEKHRDAINSIEAKMLGEDRARRIKPFVPPGGGEPTERYIASPDPKMHYFNEAAEKIKKAAEALEGATKNLKGK